MDRVAVAGDRGVPPAGVARRAPAPGRRPAASNASARAAVGRPRPGGRRTPLREVGGHPAPRDGVVRRRETSATRSTCVPGPVRAQVLRACARTRARSPSRSGARLLDPVREVHHAQRAAAGSRSRTMSAVASGNASTCTNPAGSASRRRLARAGAGRPSGGRRRPSRRRPRTRRPAGAGRPCAGREPRASRAERRPAPRDVQLRRAPAISGSDDGSCAGHAPTRFCPQTRSTRPRCRRPAGRPGTRWPRRRRPAGRPAAAS